MAIQKNAPLRGVIQPREQLDDCVFARPVFSNQGQLLACPHGQREAADRPALALRVAEADLLKDKAFLDRTRKGTRRDSALQVLLASKDEAATCWIIRCFCATF